MLSHKILPRHFVQFFRSYRVTATLQNQKQEIVQSDAEPKHREPQADQSNHFGQIKTVFKKPAKQPTRGPLVKNFFCGTVDTDLLAYPEVIDREDMANIQIDCDITKNYFRTIANEQSAIDESVFDGLKRLKSFGVNVIEEFNGRGYNFTASNLNGEIEAEKLAIAMTMNAHQLVTKIIADSGTDLMKSTYLPKLANGELIGTVAFFEKDIPESGFLNTKSNLSAQENCYIINGSKAFVVNASNANLLVVITQSRVQDKLGDPQDSITAFLVDASTAGIQVKEADKTLGCKEVPQHTIDFHKCQVPLECVLGEVGKGGVIAQKILLHSRIQSSLLSVMLSKRIIKKLTEFCINNTHLDVKLMDMEILRQKLAKITCSTYALESMLYLTTGLLDTFENQDVEVESAIVRRFAQHSLLQTALAAYDFMGPQLLITDDPINELLRDSIQLYANSETKDSLDLFIGLSGLQHAGTYMHDHVKKVRNPLMNPAFIFKKILSEDTLDNPKITMHLSHYLHQSLDAPSKWLEQSIVRLKGGCEICLSRHGKDIIHKHMDVTRISEAATLTFAIFACLARASRSYCIGLPNSTDEMMIASTFSYDAMVQTKRLIKSIDIGMLQNTDIHYNRIAAQVFNSKGYFISHPLARTF